MRLVLDGVRVTIVRRDGTPFVVDDVVAIDVGDAVLVNESAVQAKKTRKAAPSKKTWASSPVTDAEAKAFLAGAIDDAPSTKETAQRNLSVLSYIRQRAFRMEAGSTSFTMPDATALSAVRGQGTKPSQIGRAILAAAKDPFWVQKGGISIASACRNVGSLLARKSDPRDVLRLMLPSIAKIDGNAAATLAEVLPALLPGEIDVALIEWRTRLKR